MVRNIGGFLFLWVFNDILAANAGSDVIFAEE